MFWLSGQKEAHEEDDDDVIHNYIFVITLTSILVYVYRRRGRWPYLFSFFHSHSRPWCQPLTASRLVPAMRGAFFFRRHFPLWFRDTSRLLLYSFHYHRSDYSTMGAGLKAVSPFSYSVCSIITVDPIGWSTGICLFRSVLFYYRAYIFFHIWANSYFLPYVC